MARRGETEAHRRAKSEDSLAVECWCHRTILTRPKADVRNGITGTCGAPDCHESETR